MDNDSKLTQTLEQIKVSQIEERRLWVGNLDLRINEYQFLKLVRKHGEIEKFDLLFYRSGPQAGLPRGYAFVTYKTVRDAEVALEGLQNLRVGSKNIVVRYAHSINEAELEKPKPKLDIPALAGAKKEEKRISRETAIQAIEAKLKLMKDSKEEFQLNKPLEGPSIIHQYIKPESSKPSTSVRHFTRGNYHNNRKPYSRTRPRR
ncbi:probable RNA-binding protein 18 isoform X3 [Phymastichus coffea]|uniref:probable RNA-binding protein 18 isoform X3 n=1 Tax=Phymastichus coffea TaxID=108790 RepID=UPI00273BABE8|nr:probable RNA-binding protein 18 isoform X3 [Phymastichus coffea]